LGAVTAFSAVAETALEEIVRGLELPTPIYACRAEHLLGDFRFDAVVARAVGPLWKMLKWFEPHWLYIGRLLAIKGPKWPEERGEARHRGYMGKLNLTMPKMGESIMEATIIKWLKKPGDDVELDESLLEIATDKVDSEIPSPAAGILTKIIIPENETVEVGTVIAMIETDEKSAKVDTSAPAPPASSEQPKPSSPKPVAEAAGQVRAAEASSETAPNRGRNGQRFYSPLVRTIAQSQQNRSR